MRGKQTVPLSSPRSAGRDGDFFSWQFFSLRSFLNRRLTKVFERCRLVLPADRFSFCCLLLCLSSKDAQKTQQPSIYLFIFLQETNNQANWLFTVFHESRTGRKKKPFFSAATSSSWGNPKDHNSSGRFNLINHTSRIGCLFLFPTAPLFPAVNLLPWKEPW